MTWWINKLNLCWFNVPECWFSISCRASNCWFQLSLEIDFPSDMVLISTSESVAFDVRVKLADNQIAQLGLTLELTFVLSQRQWSSNCKRQGQKWFASQGLQQFGMHSESTLWSMTEMQTTTKMSCKSANGLCASMLEILNCLETFYNLQSLLIWSWVFTHKVSHSPVTRASPQIHLRLRASFLKLLLVCFVSDMCSAQYIPYQSIWKSYKIHSRFPQIHGECEGPKAKCCCEAASPTGTVHNYLTALEQSTVHGQADCPTEIYTRKC